MTTFWNLLNQFGAIEIPQIQRDYVQGRAAPTVAAARNRLLDDIYNAFEKNQNLDLNYVYGQEKNNRFIPVDGQQRLTTLLTLHIYAFAKSGDTDSLNKCRKFSYKTRITTNRFLKLMIDELPNYFINQSNGEISAFIEDAALFSYEWKKDPSVRSFLVVLDEINQKFSKTNDLADQLKAENCPVTFENLSIVNMENINDLYIKMNSRGKLLTQFECFKSELFGWLDNNSNKTTDFKESFKQNIDNDWLETIWDLFDDNDKDKGKKCDTAYMMLVYGIIMNRIQIQENGERQTEIDALKSDANQEIFLFSKYLCFFNDDLIDDISGTFNLIRYLLTELTDENAKGRVKELIKKEKLSYFEQVRLFALTKYARVNADRFDTASFSKWFRIINNLIENTEIDKQEKYLRACKNINSLENEAVSDAHTWFANNNNLSFFDKTQIEEERLKCSLINIDSTWLNIFTKKENSYFNGQIYFALKLSGITSDTLENARQDDLEKTWKIVSLIFNTEEKGLKIGEDIFHRGLLTFGDYSIDAESGRTLFSENGKEKHFTWRRMLKEDTSFKVFQKFFNELQDMEDSSSIETFLGECIKNYSMPQDDNKDEWFRYYLIKTTNIFQENPFKRFLRPDANNPRYILYSGLRLSAYYVDAYPYFVCLRLLRGKIHWGRNSLLGDQTKTYIEKVNEKGCYIGYDSVNGYFCNEQNNAITDENGNPIKTVDDMVIYINNHTDTLSVTLAQNTLETGE